MFLLIMSRLLDAGGRIGVGEISMDQEKTGQVRQTPKMQRSHVDVSKHIPKDRAR